MSGRLQLKVNRPQDAWKTYRLKVYEQSEPLAQMQERECSLAFYAGMMVSFMAVAAIADNAADDDSGSDELEKFRQEIDAAARLSNLDRSDGQS
jgi:hypothetical protein